MNAVTAVKPGDPFEHWHDVTCCNYSVTDCRPVEGRDFRAQISIRDIGPLFLSELFSATAADDPIKIERRPTHMRRDGIDDFLLWLTLDGEASFEQNGAVARMQRGDLILHDQAQPFRIEFRTRHRKIMIRIPRPLLISRLPDAATMVARRVGSETRLGALAGSVVTHLAMMEAATNDVARRIGASALDILATTLEAELAGYDELPGQRGRLMRAKRYIDANLHDPGLDLDGIANAQTCHLARSIACLPAKAQPRSAGCGNSGCRPATRPWRKARSGRSRTRR